MILFIMTSKYEKLQETAREFNCKLTKVHPEGLAMRAPYYIHKPDGRIQPAFDLNNVASILKTEIRKQTGYNKDLMRNPLRD